MTTKEPTAWPAFHTVTVGEAMNPDVVSCPPDMPLRGVAALMAELRIHCVVVLDDGPQRPWGIVSDLDVAAGAGDDVDERRASDVAGTPVVTTSPDDRLLHAAQLMSENQTTHVVVADPATGAPVGVVSALDVARELSRA